MGRLNSSQPEFDHQASMPLIQMNCVLSSVTDEKRERLFRNGIRAAYDVALTRLEYADFQALWKEGWVLWLHSPPQKAGSWTSAGKRWSSQRPFQHHWRMRESAYWPNAGQSPEVAVECLDQANQASCLAKLAVAWLCTPRIARFLQSSLLRDGSESCGSAGEFVH